VDSNKVDRGARAEDVEISEQTVDVEEQHLEFEARAKQPTHNTFNPSCKPSILEPPNEQVDAVPYLVAPGLQKPIMRHKITCTLPTLSHFLILFVSAKSSALFLLCLISTCVVLYCNECVGFGYSHFQNGFGSSLRALRISLTIKNVCSFCGSCFAWNQGFVVHGA
jgi:hypothetical protein